MRVRAAKRDSMLGRELGHYELIRRIAVGGMAEIFLARATGFKGFERLVVLKRILPQYSSDGAFVRMFLEEARLAATLHHSNIVQVHDIGKVDDSYFFTMEYVHGADVNRIFAEAREQRDPIPLEHAIAITIGAAAGLHHAHEHRSADGRPSGIVHRDVSPSNILVGFDGAVKVVDFGIAKAVHHRNETQPGILKGKPAYMSPERYQGDPLDRRSDIFALGILFYELTTSTLLYDGKSELEILRQVTEHRIPPPSVRRPGYPAALERIVMQALAREPKDRYQTAEDFQRALESYAFAERLPVSALALSEYLKDLLGDEPTQQGNLRSAVSATDAGVDIERGSVIIDLTSEALLEGGAVNYTEPLVRQWETRTGPNARTTFGHSRRNRKWLLRGAAAALTLALGAGVFFYSGMRAERVVDSRAPTIEPAPVLTPIQPASPPDTRVEAPALPPEKPAVSVAPRPARRTTRTRSTATKPKISASATRQSKKTPKPDLNGFFPGTR